MPMWVYVIGPALSAAATLMSVWNHLMLQSIKTAVLEVRLEAEEKRSTERAKMEAWVETHFERARR